MRAAIADAVWLFMSFDSHAGRRPHVGRQHENILAAGARGQHHSFGKAETHFAWRQVRHHHDEAADQRRGIIGGADARENIALSQFAHVQMQLQQLVRSGHEFRAQHLRRAQIDAQEIVDGNQRRSGLGRT